MRDSVRFFQPRAVLLLAALVLTACGGGGGARSPDLPFPELLSFTLSCQSPTLEVGGTTQCSVQDCTFRETLENGVQRVVTRATNCPVPSWSTESPAVATVTETGQVTGVAPGNTTLTGTVEGVTATLPISVSPVIWDSADVTCRTPIKLGESSQCRIENCRGHISGGPVIPRDCPTQVGWSAAPSTIGRINNSGLFTSLGVGSATVTAQIGTISEDTTIVVEPACVQSIRITPVGSTNPESSTVVAGASQAYTATAILTNSAGENGTTNDVTLNTTFTSTKQGTSSGSFEPAPAPGNNTARTRADLAANDSAVITGTYSGGNLCAGTAISDTATLNVVVPQFVALCLEPAVGPSFSDCRTDTGACVTTPQELTVGGTAQLRLRGRYTTSTGPLECNLTNSPGSVITSQQPNVASVSSGPNGNGLITGEASGTANIVATAPIGGQTRTSAPLRFNVRLDEVLGANSVQVSAKPFSGSLQPVKFACVGATDLVGGLTDSSQLKGRLRLYAGARFCEEGDIDADGNCSRFNDDPSLPPRDVTNDDGPVTPGNAEPNRIDWAQENSYWNGAECVSTIPVDLPIGNGPPGLVGDRPTSPLNYATGNRQPNENGVVVSAGNLRIGFSCITATYHNPLSNENTDMDGMTVLVLPVTNDVLLGPSTAEDANQLCDALEPVFQLGASSNGANGVVTQLLSLVTEIVNPILQSIAGGDEPGNQGPLPVDDLVNQLLTAVSDPLTSQLFATPLGDLVDILDDTVYGPVVCGLDTLLTALLNADPEALAGAQDCVPPVPTFPFPFPAAP